MRLLVVGAGSTGGYFGGRLAQAGRDVTFLVRPGRAAQLRDKGLEIISPNGDFTVQPQIVTRDALASVYDIIFLTVKAYSLEAALEDFAPAVGPHTMILPALNGMKHMDVIAARFGASSALGGVCKISATIDEQGRIHQLAKFHELIFGETDGTTSERVQALNAFLQDAGFTATLSSAIIREMWEKWIFLASLGGITCLMRGTIGEVAATPEGVSFAEAFIDEAAAVAQAEGQEISASFLTGIKASLTAKDSPFTSSMYRDLLKGTEIEAEEIIHDLLHRAKKAGLSTPLIAAVSTELRVYQNRLHTKEAAGENRQLPNAY